MFIAKPRPLAVLSMENVVQADLIHAFSGWPGVSFLLPIAGLSQRTLSC